MDGASTAGLRVRTAGYAVDMVLFAAVAMFMAVLSGFVLLMITDWAKRDPSDRQFYLFLSLFGLGTPAAWSALNLVLLALRSQTGGQYVAGIRLRREGGGAVRGRAALAWWFYLNPLLFSWPMAIVASLPLAVVTAIVSSKAAVGAFVVALVLCVAAPVLALVSALLDPRHRALHDRVADVIAVPVN